VWLVVGSTFWWLCALDEVVERLIGEYFDLVEVVERVIVREEVLGSTFAWLNTTWEQADHERGCIRKVTRIIPVVNRRRSCEEQTIWLGINIRREISLNKLTHNTEVSPPPSMYSYSTYRSIHPLPASPYLFPAASAPSPTPFAQSTDLLRWPSAYYQKPCNS
jgi:hypothetical protein